MNIETLIYCYTVICIGLIIFSVAAFSIRLIRRRSIIRRSYRSMARTSDELLENGLNLSQEDKNKHEKHLGRWLRNTRNLQSFDYFISEVKRENEVMAENYLRELEQVFAGLSDYYQRKSDMEKAYLAYLLGNYFKDTVEVSESITRFLLSLTYNQSLYCRQNAMEAIFGFGDAKAAAEAIRIISQSSLLYDIKLITDCMALFCGDAKVLSTLLWEDYDEYSDNLRIAFINYLRLRDGNWCKRVFDVMMDKTNTAELHFAAIRYFAKYYYNPAESALIDMVLEKGNKMRWEYAAIAAGALSNYKEERVVPALKSALSSPHWYVRLNASASLDRLNVNYLELSDILIGGDRYAREIMRYRMQLPKGSSS